MNVSTFPGSAVVLMSTNRNGQPTCVAASPTPFSWRISSAMRSDISRRKLLISLMRAACSRSAGAG